MIDARAPAVIMQGHESNTTRGAQVMSLAAVAYNKAGAVLVGVIASGAGFTIGELLTGKTGWSLAIGAIASVLITFIRTRPQVMNAMNARQDRVQKETEALFERIHSTDAEGRAALRARIAQQDKLLSLMTITKHALINENNSLVLHITLRGELLKQANLPFLAITPKNMALLTQEEDKLRAEIAGIVLPEGITEYDTGAALALDNKKV